MLPFSAEQPAEPEGSRVAVTKALREWAEEGLSLRVNGDCMAPVLADGDEIEVRRQRVYSVGDLIALRARDGRIVVHRFLGYVPHAGRPSILSQADSDPHHDAPVPLDRVLGRVTGHKVELTERARSMTRYASATVSALGRLVRGQRATQPLAAR